MTVYSCLNPPANMGLEQVFGCVGELTFGSLELAGIVFLIIIMYFMWQFHIPKEASLPLGVGLLIAMLATFPNSGWVSLVYLGIIGTGILFIFAFLNFFTRR